MGYNGNVIEDEIQAYLSSEPKKYLLENFKIDYDTVNKFDKRFILSDLIKSYRSVLRKYNTFEKT